MERHQADAPEQAARHSPRGRPACPQWHLLGLAIRRAVAGSAGNLRTPYDLLQSLRPLAAGWRLGPDHGGVGRCSRCGRADDRHVCRARAPTWGLHRGEQRAAHGPFAWRIDQQGPRRCRRERTTRAPRPHSRRGSRQSALSGASGRTAPANNGAGGSWLRCRLDQSVHQPAGCLGQHTPEGEPQGPHLLQSPSLPGA